MTTIAQALPILKAPKKEKELEKIKADLQRKLTDLNAKLSENERASELSADALRGASSVNDAEEILTARRNLEHEREALQAVRSRVAEELEKTDALISRATQAATLERLRKENTALAVDYDSLLAELRLAVDSLLPMVGRLEKLARRINNLSTGAGKLGDSGLPQREGAAVVLKSLGWLPTDRTQKEIEKARWTA